MGGPLMIADDIGNLRKCYDRNQITLPDAPGLGIEIDEEAINPAQRPDRSASDQYSIYVGIWDALPDLSRSAEPSLCLSVNIFVRCYEKHETNLILSEDV